MRCGLATGCSGRSAARLAAEPLASNPRHRGHSKYAIVRIMTWIVVFFSARVEAEISKMPAGFVARFIRYAERVEIYGPDLGMPHTRAMGDGLFELRLKAGEGIARVFYCTRVGHRIVVLHHFIKKTDKTPAKELLVARTRMKEIENGTNL